MLEKRVIKFERLKLGQILHADKTGFHRLGHKYSSRTYAYSCMLACMLVHACRRGVTIIFCYQHT